VSSVDSEIGPICEPNVFVGVIADDPDIYYPYK